MLSMLSLHDCRTYLRNSGLRLMAFREYRDPMEVLGECYFGKNCLSEPVGHVVDVGAHTRAGPAGRTVAIARRMRLDGRRLRCRLAHICPRAPECEETMCRL